LATNIVINKMLKSLERLEEKIKKARAVCPHDEYEVRSNYNDHDGWSKVVATWYQTRKCKLCDEILTVKTGEDRSYSY